MNPLQRRLAALRRRTRGVVLLRGAGSLLVLLLAGTLAAIALDWQFDLPPFLRALALVGILAGGVVIAYRYLIAPMASRLDDLSLALRVEEEYPVLNDALASTVQFLQQPSSAEVGESAVLRREAVQRAMRLAQGCDFGKVIDRQGVWMVAGAALLLLGVAGYVAWTFSLAPTALARLIEPFGNHTWTQLTVSRQLEKLDEHGKPMETRLSPLLTDRVAQGRPFVLRGKVAGKIPSKVRVEIDGQPQADKVVAVQDGAFAARLDMTRLRGTFRFRVLANDAVYPPRGWHEVNVVPPPRLVYLDDRPSPQIEYQFPAYTDLPSPYNVSPGSKTIEVFAGSQVTYRCAVDRPVGQAWIEFRPSDLGTSLGLQVGLVSAANPLDALTQLAGGHAVWGRVLPEFSTDRKRLTFTFQPWASGGYVLHLVDGDDDFLVMDDLADLRVLQDPVPLVALHQPSGKQMLLATATVPLRLSAEDEVFALRSVFFEVRRQDRDGKSDPTRRVPLYHHAAAERTFFHLPTTLTWPIAVPGPSLRLRPRLLDLHTTWPLAGLVKEGDVLVLQACADDFNNVSPFNPPGRSVEVELHIIGKNELNRLLDERLAEVQQDLVEVQKMQDQALKTVKKVKEELGKKGKLDPKEQEKRDAKLFDQLVEAEQTQKQIEKKVGTKAEEGLRDKLARLQQMLKDNQLPPSNLQDRVRTLNHELERLAQEEFPKIEQNLAEARKELNAKMNGKEAPPSKQDPLEKAQALQEDAKKAIDDLVRFLDPWANMHQVKSQAREILDKQRDLKKETQKLENQGRGAKEEDVARAAENQQNLAERLQDLLGKMKEVAGAQAQKGDKNTAKRLQDAAAEATKGEIAKAMKEAKNALENRNPINNDRDPQHDQALEAQQKAIQGLEKMLGALEEQRDEDVQKLLAKQAAEEAKIAELLKRQELLNKKTKDKLNEQDLLAKKKKQIEDELAKKARDPAKAKAELEKIHEAMKQNQRELEKLAEEQRKLQKLTQEKARELARLQADQAAKALNRAGQEMDRAAQMLEKGENPEEAQQEARDRLEDAQDHLQDAQEELLREQLAKIADKLKGLKERQDRAGEEMLRLHQDSVGKRNKWTPTLLKSLGNLSETQKTIAKETESLKEKLKGAKVFERILERAAKNMHDAAEAMAKRQEKSRTQPLADKELADENKSQEHTVKLQVDAGKRLQRLLDALKDEPVARKPQPKDDGGGGGGQDQNNLRGPGDGIPDVAQLKALREEQQDLNERTRAFVERLMAAIVAGGGAVGPASINPESLRMTDAQRAQLGQLQVEQADLRELFDLITEASGRKGENP